MDFSDKHQIKVGLFVTIGLTLLLTSILLLGGDQMFFKSKYQLRVLLTDVQGLARGSVVSVAGMPIGNIKELRFHPKENKIELILDLERIYAERITEGSAASVKTQGALGDRYIYIEPGPPTAAPIKEDSYLMSHESSDIFDMISKSSNEWIDVVEIIKEVHTLLSEINRDGRSALLMNNLVDSSSEFRDLMRESRVFLKELKGKDENSLRQAVLHLANILKKVDKGDGSLGALINDPSLHQRLMSLMGEQPRNRFLKPLIRESIRTTEGVR